MNQAIGSSEQGGLAREERELPRPWLEKGAGRC